MTLNVLHEHSLGWQGSNFNDGNVVVGDFPRKFNTPAPQPPTTPPATGVEAGTAAATGPNDDGVATSQAGTEEQQQSQANSITGGS